MFTPLITCLKDNDLYIEDKITNFPKGCCQVCEIDAINFNEVKKIVFSRLKLPFPKSVNAILFPETNSLYYVEMSSYYSICPQNLQDFLDWHDGENGISGKISGTTEAINTIVTAYPIDENFKEIFLNPVNRRIDTIILTEMNDEDYLMLTLSSLDKLNIGDPAGEILITNCETFQDRFAN